MMDNADILARIDPIIQQVLRELSYNQAKVGVRLFFTDYTPTPTITAPTSGASAISATSRQDETANAAVKALYEAIRKVDDEGLSTAVHLKPGDVLFNNKKVLHSRRSFSEARFDGKDRIAQRLYALFSLEGMAITYRDVGSAVA